MTDPNESDQAASPPWEFVPIADYAVPAEPVRHAAKQNLFSVRERLGLGRQEPPAALEAETDLRKLPAWQVARLAPAPDWGAAARSLAAALGDWLAEENPPAPVICLVGPPHSGRAKILSALAEQQGWPVHQPPAPEQVLAAEAGWLSQFQPERGPWLYPRLEKTYLRHTDGLSLIRRFLDQAYSGELGRGIIGCDSWAWAFLARVWHGQQPLSLALQACHQEQLAQFFRSLARRGNGQELHFRQSDNGQHIWARPDLKGEEDPVETSNFLQLLAAYSRGNLGIAWAVWRDSLQARPDEAFAEDPAETDQPLPEQTVWVPPWEQLLQQQPTLPAGAGQAQAFVLHALLLHGGLPFSLLQQLLPLSPSQTAETVFQLKAAGLVAAQADTDQADIDQTDMDQAEILQVLPRGYPAVRQFLESNVYLVDTF